MSSPLYCCPPLEWVPLDKAYSKTTATVFGYPTELKNLLAGWRCFRSLDDVALDHRGLPTIGRIQQFVPTGDSFWSSRVIPTFAEGAFDIAHRLYEALLCLDPSLARTRKLLAELAEAGMLISDDQLIRRCSNTSYEGIKAARIGSLGLISGQKTPSDFHIHLQTYLDHFRQYGRKLDVIVTDLEDFSDFKRAVLLDLKQRYACNVSYLDARARGDIAQDLMRHGVPPDRANFALFGLGNKGCNLGALKNALLLKCPSQGVMFCDVSTVCTPWWHSCDDRLPKLRVTSQGVEAYKLFRPNNRLLQVSQKPDLIASHEHGLGKLVGQVVADFHVKGHVAFESTCEHLLDSLWQGRGRVVATTNGILSVIDHMSPELARSIFTEQSSRVSPKEFAGNSWRGKLLLNSADCYTLGHEATVGNHSICLDTSANLPPFMPVGEEDQQIFFLTLIHCFPSSYVFSVPCGLPMKGKWSEQSPYDCEHPFRLRDLLIPCITSPMLRGEDDMASKAIGEGLQRLARLPAQEFREQVRSAVKEHFECNAPRWQVSSNFRKRHGSLSKILDTLTDNRNQMIQGSQLFDVADVATGSCIDDKALAVQESFMKFGDLIKSWTDILEISTNLYIRT
jgi:hypothetical protein